MPISEKEKDTLEKQLEYAFRTSKQFLDRKRFYYHPTCPHVVAEIYRYSDKGLKALDDDRPTTASMNLKEIVYLANQLNKAMAPVKAKNSSVWTEETIEEMRTFASKCEADPLNLAPELKGWGKKEDKSDDGDDTYLPGDRFNPSR